MEFPIHRIVYVSFHLHLQYYQKYFYQLRGESKEK